MEYDNKEIDYGSYCGKCKYEKMKDHQDPCEECLTIFFREHSTKPVKFEPKED